GIRDWSVTGVQTCALPICYSRFSSDYFLTVGSSALEMRQALSIGQLLPTVYRMRDRLSLVDSDRREGPGRQERLARQVDDRQQDQALRQAAGQAFSVRDADWLRHSRATPLVA